ncbi:MAG: TlpA family protein disulfide reductase, partial [Myxococcales bacterium]|nr:TlpA family protein disulfide reductase [Myxococcales bacterium]
RGLAAPRRWWAAYAWGLLTALLGALTVGCGGGSPPPRHPRSAAAPPAEEGPAQAEDPPERPPVEGAVELTLATPTGELLFLGDMRGQPILLYFFATFDVASQANLTPLDAFTRAHPEVRVIAVAVQRDARMLLDAWVHALTPAFETTFDPDNAISEGTSVLGQLGVPTFVLLDADGVPRAAEAGILPRATLEAMLRRLPAGAGGRSEPDAQLGTGDPGGP